MSQPEGTMGKLWWWLKGHIAWLLLGPVALALILVVIFAILQPFLWKVVLDESPPEGTGDLASLMTIVIALLSLGVVGFGALAYRLLGRGLEEKSRQELWRVRADLHTKISCTWWTQYKQKEPKRRHEEFDSTDSGVLEAAIIAARDALGAAQEYFDRTGDEEFLSKCKNNLAYHLATKRNLADKNTALELAARIFARSRSFEAGYHWRETYAWVQWRFGETEAEERKARDVIRELIEDVDLPSDWRSDLRVKYKHLLEAADEAC